MQVFLLTRRIWRSALSWRGGVGLGLLLVQTTVGSAQGLPEQPTPAYVRIVDGSALLERGGNTDAADAGMLFVAGDRLRTERGRVEVLFPDGTALDIDEFSDITLQGPHALRLEVGRAWISVPRGSTERTQVDTPAATAYGDGPGEFRVAVPGNRGSQTEMLVTTGLGELVSDRGSVRLQAGEKSTAVADDVPSRPERLTARADAFDNWALAQRNDRDAGRSGQYLPPDLRVHGDTLDENGSWQYESSYGYVWYPTVAVGWHPYYNGYWAAVPAYGWTWIGAERWAWPTHHYGRWGHANKGWFWIPEQHWGAAWVSWGAAPGYVSWCPLGFDNRPVGAFSASAGAGWGAGWVVLPRDRFGAGHERVGHYAVAPHTLPARTPFVTQSGPPAAASRTAVRRLPSSAQGDVGQAARGSLGQAIPREGGRAGAGQLPPSGRSTASRDNNPIAQPSSQTPPRASAFAPANGRDMSGARTRSAPRSPADETRQPTARRYPFGDFRRPDGASPAAPAQSDSAASASTTSRAVPRPRSVDVQPSVEPQRPAGSQRSAEPQRDRSTSQADTGYPRGRSYRELPSRAPTGTEVRPNTVEAQPGSRTYSAGTRTRTDGSTGAPPAARPSSAAGSNSSGGEAHGGAVRRAPAPASGASGGGSSGSTGGAVPRNGGTSSGQAGGSAAGPVSHGAHR